jgi:ABC-type transport system involved in cytochrome bd biosynthesis fused ATPase/permease subunit
VTDDFEQIHKSYNDKAQRANLFSVNVQWLANLFPAIAVMMLMILVSERVVRGEVALPAFVVILNTVKQFGPTLSDVFMNIFNINKVRRHTRD